MPLACCFATLLLAPTAAATGPSRERPDAEFLEFLAETAGEDEELVRFMESRHADRALRRAEEDAVKDEDDE